LAARTTPVRKAWRSLTWLLVIIIGLIGLNAYGVIFQGGSWVPKLALDLEGGTQIILAPQLDSGKQVTEEQLNQAVSIIRQRVDASGVSEAEINTQGGKNIVVTIPGKKLDKETQNRIESSAKLDFRAVLLTDSSATSSVGGTDSPTASPSPSPSASLSTTPSVKPTDASDLNWVTPALQAEYDNLDCAKVAKSQLSIAPDDKPLATCSDDGALKYLLGPVEVAGKTISDASNGQVTNSQGVATGQWAVNIVFNAEGTKQFAEVTTRLYSLTGARHQFAIVTPSSPTASLKSRGHSHNSRQRLSPTS
jgi:preprotein translocase subunit SecD